MYRLVVSSGIRLLLADALSAASAACFSIALVSARRVELVEWASAIVSLWKFQFDQKFQLFLLAGFIAA